MAVLIIFGCSVLCEQGLPVLGFICFKDSFILLKGRFTKREDRERGLPYVG